MVHPTQTGRGKLVLLFIFSMTARAANPIGNNEMDFLGTSRLADALHTYNLILVDLIEVTFIPTAAKCNKRTTRQYRPTPILIRVELAAP